MDTILEFSKKIELPEYAAEAVPLAETIREKYMEEYQKISADYMNYDQIQELSNKMNADFKMVQLAATILKGIDMYDEFKQRGISDEIYYSCMREITICSKHAYKNGGGIGIGNADWMNGYFTFRLAHIGRLNFERATLSEDMAFTCDGIRYEAGTPAFKIHIPEDGPLDHDEVLKSYKMAYKFYGCTGRQVFYCRSWVNYPGNYEYLPTSSNLRKFTDDFKILGRDEYNVKENSGDLFRIYGRLKSYDLDKLPRDTGLRRKLADHLMINGGIFGKGKGVFVHDGETLYNDR